MKTCGLNKTDHPIVVCSFFLDPVVNTSEKENGGSTSTLLVPVRLVGHGPPTLSTLRLESVESVRVRPDQLRVCALNRVNFSRFDESDGFLDVRQLQE